MIPQQQDDAPTPLVPAQAELQARPQWVCWRSEERNGKPTKVPYNPLTAQRAASNDPATWASYLQAKQACEQHPTRYAGIGFVFAGDYTGVDLDHCVQPDGRIDAWAAYVLEHLASYAEYSPNDGIHVLLRGTLPAGLRRRLSFASHPEAALEMYCQGRYFTVTGRHVSGTPLTIRDVTEDVQQVVADLTLIEQAAGASNGAKFRALWRGDTSGYLSPSEADQALCNILAFWTGSDPARVDRLFRASGLYRPEKWDRAARAGETYGQGTVARACQRVNQAHPGPGAGRWGAPAVQAHTGDSAGAGSFIPFPTREVAPCDLHASDDHPLPATPVAQVLESLRREEAGDAQLFTHLFRGRFVFDHTEKAWYVWGGHSWKRDETNQVVNMVSGPLAAVYLDTSARLSEQAAEKARVLQAQGGGLNEEEEATTQAKKHLAWLKRTTGALIQRAHDLRRRHRIQNVLALASAQAPLSITSDQWDANPWLLGTSEGVLDLQRGQLRPGQPDDYIRTAIPTRWQGIDAPAPRFARFLHEIFADRPEAERADLIAFLQRALGYGITGCVEEHIFLMCYGEEGRNGKDTLMSLLHYTLGPISGAVSNDILIASGKLAAPGSAKSHLCSLQGKRIAWASETDKGARFDVGQVKYLTGGGAISARQLYGRDYTFAPSHLLILLTNHKPHADASDAAFWDRLCPLLFNLRFVDQPTAPNERRREPTLLQTLKQEASGILAWLVQGCLEWQKRGLAIPPSVLQARAAYRGEEDTLQDFLQECCVLAPEARARAGKFYDRYKAWTSENNLRALNGKAFGLEMKKRFVWQKDERGTYYQGIGVMESDETGLFLAMADGSRQEVQSALQTAAVMQESSTNDGTDGTFPKLSKMQISPLYRGILRKHPSVPSFVELEKALLNQPGEPLEAPKKGSQNPDGTRQECARDFPFSRERHYVRTPTGTVGYLSDQEERGVYRHVRSVLDGRESEWLASALHSLTFEEARAWWLEQTAGTPEQRDEADASP